LPPKSKAEKTEQFVVRLPPGLRAKIAERASENGRSMNSEVVAALEKHVDDDTSLLELYRMVEDLQKQVRKQASEIEDLQRRQIT
jgi:hypothetical protein